MAIEALIERHWDELLSLRDDCLAQMLSTKPADREKLEQAIADIYELAGMKLPAQVIGLIRRSMLDYASLCGSLCSILSSMRFLWRTARSRPIRNSGSVSWIFSKSCRLHADCCMLLEG